jgi:hypothetical protein
MGEGGAMSRKYVPKPLRDPPEPDLRRKPPHTRFVKPFIVHVTDELAAVLDAHARSRLQTPSAWARRALVEALMAEEPSCSLTPFPSRMVHREREKEPA